MKSPSIKLTDLIVGVDHKEKYHSENPLARFLVKNFLQALLATVQETGSPSILEIGCGEGHILDLLAQNGYSPRGYDVCPEALTVARKELSARHPSVSVAQKSLYDLDPSIDSCDTVLCCEVMEHLTDPETALKNLLSIAKKDLILSVPNEPLWHLLNMARGQYWTALGNTPGHFQHWSKKSFVAFVEKYADIVSIKTPLPWIILHCTPRRVIS